MKILHVVSVISHDGSSGGPVRVALGQFEALRRDGLDVTLVGTARTVPLQPQEGQRIFRGFSLPGLGTAGVVSPGLLIWYVMNFWRFDRIHVHLSRDLVTLPIAVLALLRRSLIVQTHGMIDPSDKWLAAIVDRLATRSVLKRARAIVLLTRHEELDLRAVSADLARTVVVPNSVDLPKFPPVTAGSTREVTFLARLHRRKRPDLFVKMALALLDRGFDADFRLVGPDEGAIAAPMALVATRGPHAQRISWEGAIPATEVFERLANSYLYVLPAEHEPFGLTVIEALAVGTPVVLAADAAISDEILEADCGAIFDGSLENLCAVVASYLDDTDLRDRQSANAKLLAKRHYSSERLGDRLLKVYEL